MEENEDDDDDLKYKKRLSRGESDKSARAGLKKYDPDKNLIRLTKYQCPSCKNVLQNIKLDGLHFYCTTCDKEHYIKELKNDLGSVKKYLEIVVITYATRRILRFNPADIVTNFSVKHI